MAAVWGAYSLGVFLGILMLFSSSGGVLGLIRGADGRLSVSKTQTLLWSGAVAFGYAALYATHIKLEADTVAFGAIPINVLIALGFSVTTAVGAKAITVSKVANNDIQKPTTGASSAGDLVNDDDNCPDITKVQMLFWTFVAIVVFLVQTFHNIAAGAGHLEIPTIDSTLMVVMGLSQGTYLGAKLVQKDTPRLRSVTPTYGFSGDRTVTVKGQDFGDAGVVYLDESPLWGGNAVFATDSDTVTFPFPTRTASGAPWIAGQVVKISVETNGQRADGDLSLTVTAPPP